MKLFIVICSLLLAGNVAQFFSFGSKVTSTQTKRYRHHCNPAIGWYENPITHLCKYEGLTRDKFFSDNPEGSDGYYFDLTHFEHPDFSEDEIEDYIFDAMKQDESFYDASGNQIPLDAVQLLVRSHFVKLSKCDKAYLKQYFH